MKGLGVLTVAVLVGAGLGMAAAAGSAGSASQDVDCAAGQWEALEAVTGSFSSDLQGSYVMVPFEVPPSATGVRVRLSHDDVAHPLPSPAPHHTLDLGLYEPLRDGSATWGPPEFRGWGGSSRLDVCVSPAEAELGFVPGPVPAGRWAAEIGVAAVAGPADGEPDGAVAWTLEVFVSSDPQRTEPAWEPAEYDETPARTGPDWYAGDLHVHAEHSNPSDATMPEVFAYAFEDPEGPQLDFITLSDYVTHRHWDEIQRVLGDRADGGPYADDLVIRSSEVITYRGHVNNHASGRHVDHRTGPVYEWRDGELEIVRGARPASDVFADIRGSHDPDADHPGWTQVNHPTIFPSTVPAFANFCRGCSWEYSDEETDWGLVDAFEVTTGPAGTPSTFQGQTLPDGSDGALGPNPFTPLAIEWFDRLQREGHDVTAVGVSDSHRASGQDLTFAPIGEGQTVVWADELSEQAVAEAVKAGHAYVKLFGSHSPDLRLTARSLDGPGAGPAAMMGDELRAERAAFHAEVHGTGAGPGPLTLVVMRDGVPHLTVPVTSDRFEYDFVAALPGDYRLQVQRGTAVEALTNPINLEPAGPEAAARRGRPDRTGRPDAPGRR